MALSRTQRIELRERDAQVLQLRKAGATFAEIAAALGWADASTAKRSYDRAMRDTIQQPADEIRELELERLDALQKSLWARALAGNLQAVDRCLHVMDRRAKLLGLDMPTRTTVTVITRDATEQAIAELEAQLAALEDRGRSSAGPAPLPAGPAEPG